jgi:hypothetical protein
LEDEVTLNLEIPRLRNRARYESEKAGELASDAAEKAREAADLAAEQARIAAEQARQALADAGRRMPTVDVPGFDLRSTISAARKVIGDARRSLAEGGDQVMHGAHQLGQQAGRTTKDLRERVDDLRALEIRRKRGRDPWPGVTLILGVVGGIAAMFLFDPRDGARRRALLQDKLRKWARLASERARGQATHMRNVSKGLAHEVRTAIPVRGDQAATETTGQAAGEPDWPSQEAVGAAAGGYAEPSYGDSTYGDVSREPGAANGREL